MLTAGRIALPNSSRKSYAAPSVGEFHNKFEVSEAEH